jgi:glyoxylase-like metal-dependent hydrolase (beta-lactamase superfamily II)
MRQIQRGIYYEDNYLGVTLGGIVYAHGTIMIDSPLRPEDARSWRSALLNQRGGANRVLINLDAHPDRTLGDRALETTLITHQKTAQIFRNRPTIFKGQTIETGAVWETYGDSIGMRWATPDVTFTNSLSLHWGGHEVFLEHHPGSAAGATWVVIPNAKTVFVGDTVVVGQPPFMAGAELHDWINTLDFLLETYQGFTIISGRGGPASVEDVKTMQKLFETLINGLERLAKRNAPPEATQDLVPALMSEYGFKNERGSILYTQRLRYGLYHYYNRRYRSAGTIEEQLREEEEEEQ